VNNPYVDRYIRGLRSKVFRAGMFAAKGDEGTRTAIRIGSFLRRGGTVGLLADLVDWRGVQVPFFGQLVWATTAPASFARRAGTCLWIGRTVRIGKQSRFKITFRELKVPRTSQPDDDIKEITASIYRQFEEWIREYPEQWMWSNKRFKDHELPGGTQY
jgi:KDO2-lipid IV(A) lauroyltransferase